jgi:hypothetical protein
MRLRSNDRTLVRTTQTKVQGRVPTFLSAIVVSLESVTGVSVCIDACNGLVGELVNRIG